MTQRPQHASAKPSVPTDIGPDAHGGAHPLTLAIDIGGTRLKAGVLDAAGAFVTGPARVATPKQVPPSVLLDAIEGIVRGLGPYDRVSAGFPGMIRRGRVLTAPNLGTDLWHDFALTAELARRFNKPARMLNDATVQGLGVIEGRGLECVITLGTGMGFALFRDGGLTVQLEFGQSPVRKNTSYDAYIGGAALEEFGTKRWNRRVQRVLDYLHALSVPDQLYIGGGNAKHITFTLPANTRIVPNEAGITGGVRLWDAKLDDAFAPATAH